MNILITGTNGFIGKAVHTYLKNMENTVISLHYSKPKSAFSDPNCISFPDLLDGKDKISCHTLDAVIHCAAIRHRWGTSREQYYRANVEYPLKIMHYVANNKFGNPIFLFLSSVSVFGWQSENMHDQMPHMPAGDYGWSKSVAETQLLEKSKILKIPLFILRPAIVYGPGDETGMITRLCKLLENGSYIQIGKGENLQHLIYISDVVQAVSSVLSLINEKKTNQISAVTIAGEQTISMSDLVGLLCKKLDCKKKKLKFLTHLHIFYPGLLRFFTAGVYVFQVRSQSFTVKVLILYVDRENMTFH
jgi:UDP-glucose 4-epimerase